MDSQSTDLKALNSQTTDSQTSEFKSMDLQTSDGFIIQWPKEAVLSSTVLRDVCSFYSGGNSGFIIPCAKKVAEIYIQHLFHRIKNGNSTMTIDNYRHERYVTVSDRDNPNPVLEHVGKYPQEAWFDDLEDSNIFFNILSIDEVISMLNVSNYLDDRLMRRSVCMALNILIRNHKINDDQLIDIPPELFPEILVHGGIQYSSLLFNNIMYHKFVSVESKAPIEYSSYSSISFTRKHANLQLNKYLSICINTLATQRCIKKVEIDLLFDLDVWNVGSACHLRLATLSKILKDISVKNGGLLELKLNTIGNTPRDAELACSLLKHLFKEQIEEIDLTINHKGVFIGHFIEHLTNYLANKISKRNMKFLKLTIHSPTPSVAFNSLKGSKINYLNTFNNDDSQYFMRKRQLINPEGPNLCDYITTGMCKTKSFFKYCFSKEKQKQPRDKHVINESLRGVTYYSETFQSRESETQIINFIMNNTNVKWFIAPLFEHVSKESIDDFSVHSIEQHGCMCEKHRCGRLLSPIKMDKPFILVQSTS